MIVNQLYLNTKLWFFFLIRELRIGPVRNSLLSVLKWLSLDYLLTFWFDLNAANLQEQKGSISNTTGKWWKKLQK